jgi:hypothetical protein
MHTLPILLIEEEPMRLKSGREIEFCDDADSMFIADFEVTIEAEDAITWNIVNITMVYGKSRTELTGDIFNEAADRFEDRHHWLIADHINDHVPGYRENAAYEEYESQRGM